MQWDVFISHAWEDNENFVKPLATALNACGLRVWYDEFTLQLGDNLRRSIDKGLTHSKFGIVVLSHAFFKKEWTQYELDGLVQRETEGEKVILPVWHEVTREDVLGYSPPLANKVAVNSTKGMENVVAAVLKVVRPELVQPSPSPITTTGVQTSLVQTLLNNQYRPLNKLDSDGFGNTFLAEDIHQPSRRCVVKQLKPISDPSVYKLIQEHFEREALILGELGEGSNGHIPKLYDYFAENGFFYLVQEFIEGQTLRKKVENEGPLNVTAVMEIMGSLLSVLDYVHSRNRIHGDIKPDNVMLRQEDGKPVLIDLGFVKEVRNLDSQGNPTTFIQTGTLGYMPLEQQTGNPLNSSDLYALGWTGIYLLTGRQPQHFLNGLIQWRELAQGVDSRFADILGKATELHFANRYNTTQEMLNALHYAGGRIQHDLNETLTNSIGMKFVLIQPGSFTMGTMGSKKKPSEQPAHCVTINQSFWMGKYQVTQAEWRSVMGSDPSKFKGDDLPVEMVSWNDLQKFLEKLNAEADGYTYRLPTEAEWEYACRADSTGEYCFGDNTDELGRYAWYAKKEYYS
ncbi:SUMF1/EgtB/PvdO family nonheme iron enzyme [Candidatus Poribacteria bacterium]|nr:SUMF1/EgtB/PvdO family nonheme iron enzyme [Candidatus Poribacteria bacterium]